MEHGYKQGKIVAKGGFYEPAIFHVSNEKISAVFDGKGALTYYANSNGVCLSQGCFSFMVNGAPTNWCNQKKVVMIGRKQNIYADIGAGSLKITQFVDKNTDGVFFSYELYTEDDFTEVDLLYYTDKIDALNIICNGEYKIIKER